MKTGRPSSTPTRPPATRPPKATPRTTGDEYETTLHVHDRRRVSERATMVLSVPLALLVAQDLRTQGFEVTLVIARKRKAGKR